MRRTRLVLDTNVLVSAFLWGGTPGALISLAGSDEATLFTSRVLLAELAATLSKPRLQRFVATTGRTATEIAALYGQLATVVPAKRLRRQVARDRDDDAVLACAVAARADLIVTGDDDLLSLHAFKDTPIVKPVHALRLLRSA